MLLGVGNVKVRTIFRVVLLVSTSLQHYIGLVVGCYSIFFKIFNGNNGIRCAIYLQQHYTEIMRYFFLFIKILAFNWLWAQSEPIPMGAGKPDTSIPTPSNINASDGIYDKFVLIRWEGAENTSQYRLFRANTEKGASMIELSKTWQKSTWFCDYSAEAGKDYYYAVMGNDGKNSTPLTRFDKGYLRKGDGSMANDESLSDNSTQERLAAAKQVFMLVSIVQTDTTHYLPGAKLGLQVGVQNIFDEFSPRTDFKIYLSSDVNWTFDDQLLETKSYSGFPANSKAALEQKITLPDDLLPGAYHLIVVASPEGNILNAKTGTALIQIIAP